MPRHSLHTQAPAAAPARKRTHASLMDFMGTGDLDPSAQYAAAAFPDAHWPAAPAVPSSSAAAAAPSSDKARLPSLH